ncbi:hypothetical protein HWA94_gp76 [Pseudomonas phage ZC08]|uniref:Uncharacterized protein n=1 Tax=Pseudomonas phage ZC08 TaxID=1622116 RepID=A0A1L2C9I8_9CAUD|nr:hypothetical protein HWA94_gp76 [Pseudomonas phage ZC08]AMD43515.1 hypothetical protein ZC08_050 [Pseudomonas phage ZC08]
MKHPECSMCGSDQVVLDAYAEWSYVLQEWVLQSTFDDAYCLECEESTEINWVEDE